MSVEFDVRATQFTVARKGEEIFADDSTRVEIDDEAAGEFIAITQSRSAGDGRITIDRDEWPLIRYAVDQLIGVMRHD